VQVNQASGDVCAHQQQQRIRGAIHWNCKSPDSAFRTRQVVVSPHRVLVRANLGEIEGRQLHNIVHKPE
jgi:hypothetical protein